jgi:CDP-diacylglycerol--glycerol-3-phosphate 3-phosphatidyltransferase
MTPNQVTLARVAAAFAAVALFTAGQDVLPADLAAVVLTVAAIALDGVDGYIARTRGLATPLGAQLDILGDRVVENLFFTCFAVSGLISLWVPVVFFVRGALTDFIRGLAARAGRTGFARNSMLETRWGRILVASRASRAAYATLKCICFCYLGLLLPLRHPAGVFSDATFGAWFAAWLSEPVADSLLSVGRILTGVTVLFCLVRAFPVIWEGRRYLVAENPPRKPLAVPVIR